MAAETRPASSDERVLFFPEVEAFGGGERSYLALLGWLHAQGIPHRALTYRDAADIERFAPFPLAKTQLLPPPGARAKIASLKRHFGEREYRYTPMVAGLQGALHATSAGMRGFHTLMLDTPTLFKAGTGQGPTPKERVRDVGINLVLRRGLNSGGRTIVNSEFLRNETRRLWKADADIIRMGGLEGEHEFRPRRPQGGLRMLSISRIEANKRIDWMVRALAELERGERPLSARVDWHLDVAGKGSLLDASRELARSLGVGDRVHFLGFVPDERVEELYANADVFLMPAVQGYGIPAIESLTRGLPVLLHRESGVSDILLDTPWCVVIEGDERAMAPGLLKIVESILRGDHLNAPLPNIPTEAEWAERVARDCGWLG